MESQIKASFIPKDVGKPAKLRRETVAAGGDLIVLLAIILVIASIALAASMFLYAQYLTNSIATKQSSIDRARASIEPDLIDQLSRLDARMQAAGTLLSQHLAPSVLFDLLQQVTLQSIQLTDLDVTADNLNSIKITIKGKAKSVNAIALQSDLYGKSGIITSPIFSNINQGTDGLMEFQMDGLLDPDSMRYVALVQAASSGAATTQTQPAAQTTTAPNQAVSGSGAPAAGTTASSSAASTTGSNPAFTPVP